MKVLFYDTESTDLAASFGRLLCTSFLYLDEKDPWTIRGDQKPYKGRNAIDDSKLAVATRDTLEAADIIVGWNSILHDVAFINGRLAKAGERPCHLGEKYGTWHLDLMWYAGGQSMKLGGKSLNNVSRFFDSPNRKTPLDGDIWQLAGTGDSGAMDSVVEHCEYDVRVTKDMWPHLAPYVKKFTFSLSEVWSVVDQIPSRQR